MLVYDFHKAEVAWCAAPDLIIQSFVYLALCMVTKGLLNVRNCLVVRRIQDLERSANLAQRLLVDLASSTAPTKSWAP